MKLAKHNNNYKSNIDTTQSQEFGIGDASVVIEILRNRLYKHKIRTCVQEYICNGRDAMREIDSKKDIEITAPTRLNPVFKVRDYGPGINPDRIKEVFVLYGASTKRKNNKQTGGFGIGAKSAWSYTDSFTIITYVDGTKRTYVAHTGVNNNGRLDLIAENKTNELNGTEIHIAVNERDLDEFTQSIRRCVFFWDNGYKVTNLDINPRGKGETINQFIEIGYQDNLPSNIADRYSNDIVCTIDGVPYKLTSFRDKIESLDKVERLLSKNFIVHLPNGLVEVSASREEISDSKHTVKHLTRLFDDLYKQLDKELKSRFAKAKSVDQFMNTFTDLSSKFNLNDYTEYDEYKLSHSNIESELFQKVGFLSCHIDHAGRLFKDDRNKANSCFKPSISIYQKKGNKLFYDVGDSKVKLGKRLRQYLANSRGSIIVIENTGNQKAFDKIVKDFGFRPIDEIVLPDVPKKPRKIIKRSAKEFCIHKIIHGYRKETDHITLEGNDTKYHYVELDGSAFPAKYQYGTIGELEDFLNIKICGLSKTSIKHVEGDKNFKPLEPLLSGYKPTKTVIDRYKAKIAEHKDKVDFLNKLGKIKNKQMNELVSFYSKLPNQSLKLSRRLPVEISDKVTKHKDVKDFIKKDSTFKDIFKDFPLVDFNQKDKDDLTMYINEKTKILNKGGK